MDNIDLLYGCFNQYAFNLAKENINDIESFYNSNAATRGNTLVGSLINAIRTYDLSSIDLPLFQSILMKNGKTPAEQDEIIKKIITYKQYTKDQMVPIKKYIKDMAAFVLLKKANQLYKDSPSECLKFLKTANYKSDEVDYLKVTGFKGIDINTIISDASNDCIPSKFDFINRSFTNGGYNRGQLVLASFPPGTGKTLFAMEELLNMALKGYKCFYYAAGDIGYKDFLIRMGAQYTGRTFFDTSKHLAEIFYSLSDALGDNLDICITPAGVISPRELVDYIKNNPKRYDVIAIDYDSNLKIDTSNSMYDAYGSAYATFSELTVDPEQNRLLFVLAQPKVNVWGEQAINLSDVGESSRKQHTADVIITRGRVVGNSNHLGQMKIVKNRRGETDVDAYSIRLNNGRTKIIPKAVFDELKNVKEKQDYTESAIDLIVNQYLATQRNMQNRVNKQFQSASSGPTPF